MEIPPASFDKEPLRFVTIRYGWKASDRNKSAPPPFQTSGQLRRGIGMSSTGSAEYYRAHAAQCVGLAHKAPDHETRLWLLDMAQAWLVLAEHANKNMGAPASIYETPEQQHAIQQQQQPQTDE